MARHFAQSGQKSLSEENAPSFFIRKFHSSVTKRCELIYSREISLKNRVNCVVEKEIHSAACDKQIEFDGFCVCVCRSTSIKYRFIFDICCAKKNVRTTWSMTMVVLQKPKYVSRFFYQPLYIYIEFRWFLSIFSRNLCSLQPNLWWIRDRNKSK